jgi:signal transduction histidine kinase
MGRKFKINPSIIIAISLTIGIVMIASAYYELKQSKEEIYHLLHEQASSLIETISLSSINTLSSSYEIEGLIAERLMDNARLIKRLDSLNSLTQKKLIEIGIQNNLYRINVFDKNGNRILSNRIPTKDHPHPEGNVNRYEEIEPILTGKTQELIIGLKNAQYSDEQRYAVAISRSGKKGAIVINLDAKNFLEFRKRIGIGKIIQEMGGNSGIEFIALQDNEGILAASKNVDSLSSINEDTFLQEALEKDSIYTRIINFKGTETFEVIKRLKNNNEVIGIYRVGLALDEIRSLEARMYRRIIIISLILAAISIIVLSILFTMQNLKTVSNEYKNFKTLSSSVLQNMAEAVIVLNSDFLIILFNKFSEQLFEESSDVIINKEISEIMNGKLGFIKNKISTSNDSNIYFDNIVEINNEQKILSISITKNLNDKNKIENHTIVINDLTQTKNLEEQAKRQEKLSAMGELASGVAHEIRNPINSIGMIAQRLRREFEPKNDSEEYGSIIKVLKDEVDRINKIISQFLNYAKPIELQKKKINVKDFFNEIYLLFSEQANVKNINFNILTNENLEAEFDPELIKQSIFNLVQNAFDSVNDKSKVSLKYYLFNSYLYIEVIDTGSGITDENKKKIFDLYFTTRKDGNGLGLSITQKIVSQHNGYIKIENNLPSGTIFKIILPQNEKY